MGDLRSLESVLLLCVVAVTRNKAHCTEIEGVTTASLNLVHPRIGSAEERITTDSVNRVPADPDARGDADGRIIFDPHRLANRSENAGNHRGQGRFTPASRQDDDEFIASQTAHHVFAAHQMLHALAGNFQNGVSRGMTERIVEVLEVVEIDKQYRER